MGNPLPINQIVCGDCIEVMKGWPEQSIQCCVTSPPYFGLRDYGVEGQLGLEATPEEFVAKMVEVFREVKRILRDDGTLWLNLGSSYAGGGGSSGHTQETENCGRKTNTYGAIDSGGRVPSGFKHKDLVPIPWMVALALQADGWYLRQDIIWKKPNPMPESCTDRCTKAHEYIFLLTKKPRYYYDAEAIAEPTVYPNDKRRPLGSKGAWQMDGREQGENGGGKDYDHDTETKNKRSVWTVPTKSFSEAHFATFPSKLIEPCILAGTSAKGCCPECGGPWERIVEKTGGSTGKSWHNHADDLGGGMSQPGKAEAEKQGGEYTVKTTGWRPTCIHCIICDELGLTTEQRKGVHDATQRPRNRERMAAAVEQKAVGEECPASTQGETSQEQIQGDVRTLPHNIHGTQERKVLQSDMLCEMDVGTQQAESVREKRTGPIQNSRHNKGTSHNSRRDVGKAINGHGTCTSQERQSSRQQAGKLGGENISGACKNSHEASAYHELKPYPPIPCVVFDPFMGAATTAVVAIKHGRNYVGTELSPEYIEIAKRRIRAVDTGVPVKEADKGQGALFS